MHLFTRRGHDWTERYPAIASAAAKLRAKSFTIDGEAVVTGPDGVSMFEAYAFDLLELNGKDLRQLPLGERKAKLERLLTGAAAGIVFNGHTASCPRSR